MKLFKKIKDAVKNIFGKPSIRKPDGQGFRGGTLNHLSNKPKSGCTDQDLGSFLTDEK